MPKITLIKFSIAPAKIEGVAIVKANKSFVLISQEEIEALVETIELLRDPILLDDIQQTGQDYSRGEVLTCDQVFG